MKKINKIEMYDILRYEVHSHWLASWISNSFLQNLMGKYFAWKVARKYKRYVSSLEIRNQIFPNKRALTEDELQRLKDKARIADKKGELIIGEFKR